MAMTATVAPPEQRAVVRNGVSFTIRAFGPDARRQLLPLLDISPHGLMAEWADGVPGDRLRLMLPGDGVMAATVRWCREGRIGCRFDSPLDPARYYELLAEMLRPHDPLAVAMVD